MPIAPAPTRTVTLLIVGEAREARMRRATNAWAAQTWPEISIGAVGPGPVEGEHRYGPGDEAFAIYAVQRTDREQAIAVMDALRDLHARVRSTSA